MSIQRKTISELPYILDPDNNLKILIDTGSTKSYVNPLIAEHFYPDKFRTEPFVVKTAHGSSIGEFTTLVPCDRIFNKRKLNLKFNVFNFHPKFDLLLGLDSLKILKSSIDLNKNLLLTPETEIPLLYLGRECADLTLIEARSVQQVRIRIANMTNGEAVVPYTRIGKLEIPESLVSIKNQEAYVRILNPEDKDRKFAQIAPIQVDEIENLPDPPNFANLNNYFQENFNFSFDLNKLRTEHMNPEERTAIEKVVSEFQDIFHLGNQPLSFTNRIKHKIRTTDEIPIYSRNYRFPEIYREEIDRQVEEMLKQGIVQHSDSPYNSPIFLVPKKTPPGAGPSEKPRFRLVVDYRSLNARTIDDKYPLPPISDLLDKLGRCQYFSVIDLQSGFHQIEMESDSQSKTAFSTPNYHLEFTRMPFGLKNAPSTFQRLMDNILRGVANEYCCVYMDDIIVFSVSLQEHIERLRAIFKRLRAANLKIQLEKTEFLRKEVTYLGHVVTDQGVRPDPSKIKAISKYPIPSTTTEIKSFLGLLGYYRRFIANFADVTKPMTRCLKKGNVIDINDPEYIACFEKCKTLLANDPILQYPDFSKPFSLTTDASSVAIGCVLSQNVNGADLPIGYASRTLTDPERRLDTIHRELLAIVWGVQYFRPYLFGRKFKVFSDHQPLQWLNSVKEPSSKLFRWKLKLAAYDMEIHYKKGSANANADALSRVEILNQTEDNELSPEYLDTELDDLFATLTPGTQELLNNLPLETADNESVAVNLPPNPPNLEDFSDEESDNETVHSNIIGNTSVTIPIRDDPINKCKSQIIVQGTKIKSDVPVKVENPFPNKTRITVQIPIRDPEPAITSFIKEYVVPKTKYGIYFEHDLYQEFTKVLMQMFTHSEISLTKYSHMVKDITTETEQTEVIKKYHEGFTNHRGIQESYQHLKRTNYWPDMRQAIQKFINNCPLCVKMKYDRVPLKIKYNVTPTASRPLETLFADVITLEKTKFLTIVDSFSKFAQAYPLPSSNSIDIIEAFVTHFSHHGTPSTLSLDNAPEFQSALMREFALAHDINLHFVASQRPESQGIVERFHSTLVEHIRLLNRKNPFTKEDVKSKVKHALLGYNNSIHSALGKYTPFEILYGHASQNTLLDLSVDQTLVSNYISRHKEKMTAIYHQTHDQMHANKSKKIEKLNENREDLPPIPTEVHIKTIQKQSKTKPKYNKEKINEINPELKIATIVPRHHNQVEKIHLSNVKRPRKFTRNELRTVWDETSNPNETIVERFGLTLRRNDLISLKPPNWLNDNIVNFQMEIINEKNQLNQLPVKVNCFSCFLYQSFVTGGYTRVKRWTKDRDIFSYDLLIFPIFKSRHWRLVVAKTNTKELVYLDSMGLDGTEILESINQYLVEEHLSKKQTPLDPTYWSRITPKTPRQVNNDDCGVFLCAFAKLIAENLPVSQLEVTKIPQIREELCLEILNYQ